MGGPDCGGGLKRGGAGCGAEPGAGRVRVVGRQQPGAERGGGGGGGGGGGDSEGGTGDGRPRGQRPGKAGPAARP